MKKAVDVHQKTVVLGLFLAIAMILALFETYIPRPLPWAKPGLANVVTILVIYLFGLKEALLINTARVVLVSFLTGGFAGPAFWLALAASLLSALAMFVALTTPKWMVGPIGLSMIGAYLHILVQLLLAGVLIVGRIEIFYLLPLFIVPSFFSGILVGIFAVLLLTRLEKRLALRYRLPARQ